MLNYKGYVGHVEYDENAEIFCGEVINIKDVITFQGKTVKEIKKAFIDSIDDYLDFCSSRGEKPEKPFSGKLNLRLTPDIHREAYIVAKHEGVSLNSWIVDTVKEAIHHHQQV
jgi:predicted HicB family RNase H-like nuclease